jgi:hypothetical protein
MQRQHLQVSRIAPGMIDTDCRSACPVTANKSIEAAGIIPVSQNDVAGIPDIALYIPDFEGQAILRLFSNSTQAEIGCFAAQITNGNSFRQKTEVGTILGGFTLVAILSSLATATYGDDIVEMRKHYAHSPSVMVIFAVWHHIYFSGALSVNWPNVLVSFWSNYAWTGGMIYSEHMQNLINDFIGSNKGNTSQVGAAGTGVNNPGLGGGYDIHAIYKREIEDPSSNFAYTGHPVKPGLPLPGNFSGFAGTLAQEQIPASNAFMTCLLWSLVLVACIIISIAAFKVLLEGLRITRLMRRDRLLFFRAHYVRYIAFAVLRAGFIGFFMMAFISMFQLSYLKSPGPVAVACAVILVVVFGTGTAAGLACYRRVSAGKYVCERDTLDIEKIWLLKIVPWFAFSRQSKAPRSEDKVYLGSLPWWTIQASPGEKPVQEDEHFIRSFGWLTARYRAARWWFFVVWLIYEFIRACFLAGASSQPLVQVFGLVGVEFVAFIGIICLRPFEGQRLNTLLAYLLGFSKLVTTALSAAFDTRLNLPRIPATIVGIIIIIIQSLLTMIVLILIIVGAVTSYLSIMRNRAVIYPRRWIPTRERYFERISSSAHGIPRPCPVPAELIQEVQHGTYFRVDQVQRVPKVEDEDVEFVQEIYNDASSQKSLSREKYPGNEEWPLQRDRAASDLSQTSHSALPRAARLHRPSWTSQELTHYRGVGRARASSNATTCTPKSSSRASNRALPQLDAQSGNCEKSDRHPSPFSNDQNRGNLTSSPIPHPYDDIDGSGLLRRPGSQRGAPSRASSRPPLEARISEEDIPPMPRKASIASIRLVNEVE